VLPTFIFIRARDRASADDTGWLTWCVVIATLTAAS